MTAFANAILDLVGSLIVSMLFFHSREKEKEFRRLLLTTALILVLDALCWALSGLCFPGSRLLQWLLNSAYYLSLAVCGCCWLLYTVHWICTERIRQRGWRIVLFLSVALEAVLLVLNGATGWMFYITEDCLYRRGPLFLPGMTVLLLYAIASVCVALWMMLSSADREKKKECLFLALFMLLPMTGAAAQFFLPDLSVTPVFLAVSFLMIYLTLQEHRQEREKMLQAKREDEIFRMHVTVMLSQIQPHFLFNALNVIQYQCEEKSDDAVKTVESFARYLRGNLQSLSWKEPVPFCQELEHLNSYLYIEKLRFPDANVEFRLACENFSLPVLTLQPLVENAIRYGVTQKDGGGTVTISTHEDEDFVYLEIDDDGVGFDPEKVQFDSNSRVGISHTRERLASMCRGKLEARSIPGEGNKVRIILPKENCR